VYGVDDIESASAELRAAGMRLLYAEPKRGTAGSRVNFIHPKDAGGVLVELVEAATAGEAAGEVER
jgi:methylmalonyl-CoA/ethylmalonyl-CoA epimerase